MSLYKKGAGLINSAIDKLPFELHFPGYQYCGPGTKLKKRLSRGDPGINKLDSACKEHDIVYDKHKSDEKRAEADQILSSKAWDRVVSGDAGFGERAAALAVSGAMKTKIALSKLGKGLPKMEPKPKPKPKRKKMMKKKHTNKRSTIRKFIKKDKKKMCCTFKKLVQHTKKSMKDIKPTTQTELINTAIAAAKNMKESGIKISQPRIIPIPKTGGVLPLIPIFAGLSALGSLIGGGAAVGRAVSAAKEAQKQLEESRYHNREMEAIAIANSKRGSGLYLKPYKKGYGIYLSPYPKSKNH